MKFFNKLILWGIIVSTVLLSQSVKISNGLIVRNSSDYINIFIYLSIILVLQKCL